ncbi:bifunctional 3-deoxy-7-phosphoheptulonate synthase/chorismate mutase, partial [Bacillus sp. JR_15]
MSNTELDLLRQQANELNLQILKLINERGRIVQEIGKAKEAQGINRYDPVRERAMLNEIIENNDGPFENSTIQHIFKEIFKAGLELQEDDHSKALLVSRKKKPENTIVDLKGEKIGDGEQRFIVGPCAVESYEQVAEVAAAAKKQGLKLLRGGAFKPRTSPYDFQGLGVEGLQILKRVADEYDLAVISEIVNPQHIEEAIDYIDVIQIGARNMQNFEL